MEENLETAVKECEENKFYVKVSFVIWGTVVARPVLFGCRGKYIFLVGEKLVIHTCPLAGFKNFSEVLIAVG